MKNNKRDSKIAMSLIVCLSIIVIACNKNSSSIDIRKYTEEIKQWQTNRSKQISREDGWLSLAGLFWLEEGINSIGSDPTNVVVLPKGSTPQKAGTITLKNGKLSLISTNPATFKYKDSLITKMNLISDEAGKTKPTILTAGSTSFFAIKRGDKFGIRIKDKNNPALKNFKSLDFYSPNPEWRINGVYKLYTEPKVMEIASVIGTVETDTFRGTLNFQINEKKCNLDVTSDPVTKELYLMFTDETTGKETYGNGRQLSISKPDENGNVIIDFNKAINWPCAYTPYATCPIPPKQNHIPVRIEAGEKKYPASVNH
jgi:uncharacterized protein (DUF1684 family)